jgi:N utilization substance protein A
MNREDLLRLVDMIHRDKDIPAEIIFQGLERAIGTAVKKRLGAGEDLVVAINRKSGEINIEDEEGVYEFDLAELGRIAAQAFKQGFIQALREAERDVLYDDYETRVGQIVNGTVQRYDGDALVVNLGRAEASLPREERVRGETFGPGDRIRAIVLEVRKDGPRVRITISRTHPDLVRRLFELEVPEIADSIIEIKRVVREPGYRTKMAVISQDPKIDCIGACVGVRGSRIKAVIDELRGERIDIIRWSDSLETLVMNGLKPATIHLENIYPEVDQHSVTVVVDDDQQSLAIGKKGQNVRLASRLCGWDIDIKTREQFEREEAGLPPLETGAAGGVSRAGQAESGALDAADEAQAAEAGLGGDLTADADGSLAGEAAQGSSTQNSPIQNSSTQVSSKPSSPKPKSGSASL